MKGFICTAKVRTNEDYKRVVKNRMKLFAGMGLIGAITMVVGLLAEFLWTVSIDDEMLGIYTGFGTGLLVVSIVMWVMNLRLLGNDEKLKESRINDTDERLQEIGTRALTTATVVLLVALYGTALIGGLFYPFIVTPIFILVSVFVVAYFAAYFYYKRKM